MGLTIGLMSGTSVDGIDAALVEIEGSGATLRAQLRAFECVPFEPDLRQRVLRLAEGQGDVREVTRLHFALGEAFASAARHLLEIAGVESQDVECIGSHGQTVCHLPGEGVTLQLGQPAIIAERMGITTVADFRPRDMACGGQGAPLVPYADWCLSRQSNKNIIVQNIGGIANGTLLPAGYGLEDVRAWDSGPGNMVLDECARALLNQERDDNGATAAQGQPDEAWLPELLTHPFVQAAPPKTCGREEFGRAWSESFVREGQGRGLSTPDILATATAFTARSIADSYRRFAGFSNFEMLLGGGGASNPTLRRMLAEAVAPNRVQTHEATGGHSNAREAVAFAILAHETLRGVPTNVPGATGARETRVLGAVYAASV